jgi:hypothetical protein
MNTVSRWNACQRRSFSQTLHRRAAAAGPSCARLRRDAPERPKPCIVDDFWTKYAYLRTIEYALKLVKAEDVCGTTNVSNALGEHVTLRPAGR